MSAEILELHPGAVGDGFKVTPDDVLQHAIGRLDSVLVVGLSKDGDLYVAGSHGAPDSAFLAARAQHYLVTFNVSR